MKKNWSKFTLFGVHDISRSTKFFGVPIDDAGVTDKMSLIHVIVLEVFKLVQVLILVFFVPNLQFYANLRPGVVFGRIFCFLYFPIKLLLIYFNTILEAKIATEDWHLYLLWIDNLIGRATRPFYLFLHLIFMIVILIIRLVYSL